LQSAPNDFTGVGNMLKAAVVGVGYLGKFHAEKYARSKHADLVAVVDLNRGAAEKCADELGALALSDYKELGRLGVVCASVASATSSHYEVAKWLLEHGIDVLVEKPMTVRVDEAAELNAIAKREGRIIQVGHLERFNPAFVEMERRITKPFFLEARRIASFTGRGADVDVVLDLMIHDLDIILHLVRRPVRSVEALGVPVLTNSVDIANARITFEGGVVANVTASRAAFKVERTISIFQPGHYFALDYGSKKLRICTKNEESSERALPPVSVEEMDIETSDALNDEIHSFLDCVKDRRSPVVTGEDGMKALELAERVRLACAESAEELGQYACAGRE